MTWSYCCSSRSLALLMVCGFIGASSPRLIPGAVGAGGPQRTPVDATGFSRARMPFLKCEGPVDSGIAYYAPTLQGTVQVTKTGDLVHLLTDAGEGNAGGQPSSFHRRILSEAWIDGQAVPRPGPVARTRASFYLGSDADDWRFSLPTYASVTLGEVWPGVKVELRARGHAVEKLFTVSPKAEVSRIRVRVGGIASLGIGEGGSLRAREGANEFVFSRPQAWQETPGAGRKAVQVSYWVRGMEYGFVLGDRDPTKPVVIDPILQSTYLGGGGDDGGYGIAIHSTEGIPELSGAVYLAGVTDSLNLPSGGTTGAQPTPGGNRDVFVACFNAQLTELLSITYLGGSGDDTPGGGGGGKPLMVHAGKVFVTGNTSSTDFPIPNTDPLQPRKSGGQDAFVAELTADLWTLERATYLGGNGHDFALSIVGDPTVERGAYVYLAGQTTSTDFPGTTEGYQDTHGGGLFDAFVARLHYSLETRFSEPLRATYLGGRDYDKASGIDLDVNIGEAFVVGETMSDDLRAGLADPPALPPAADQPSYRGGTDAFVAKFSPDLREARNISYFGGTGSDQGFAIAVPPGSEYVYLAGQTSSGDLLDVTGVSAAAQGILRGVKDAFVARFNGDLAPGAQGTFLGGASSEVAHALAFGPALDEIYVLGNTLSDDFPGTSSGAQTTPGGGGDAFVARLDAGLGSIRRATYLGGNGQDTGLGMAANPVSGEVYLTGLTTSQDFPEATGAAQAEHGGGSPVFRRDAYVTRLDATLGAESIGVEPRALVFPYLALGDRASRPITIANRGADPLTVRAFELSEEASFALLTRSEAADGCPTPPFALAPGTVCTLEVEYAPVADGDHAAVLTVISDDDAMPGLNVTLEGGTLAANWLIQTLGRGVQSLDLAIDDSDRVHLCYFAPASKVEGPTLRYAHCVTPHLVAGDPVERPGWSKQSLVPLSAVGTDCAMAVETDGTYHIAYVVDDTLYYLKRGSAPVQIATGVAPECSIAVGREEVPLITYGQYAEFDPSVGRRERPIPHCAYIPTPGAAFLRTSLIPGTDMPGRSGAARRWSAITFAPPGLDGPDDEIPWALFTVDDELVLYRIDLTELRFPPDGPAVANDFQTPDLSPHAGRLVVDEVARSPVYTLAGLDARTGTVTVEKFLIEPEGIRPVLDRMWKAVEEFTAGGGAPEDSLHLSLATRAGFSPCLAFYDRYDTSLKYVDLAWRSSLSVANCPRASCGRSIQPHFTETVDGAGDVGRSVALAFNRWHAPHIAYLDVTSGTVKFARRIPWRHPLARLSPSRWHFAYPGDWRAFSLFGTGDGELVVRDARIEHARLGRTEDWLIDTACDLEHDDLLGDDLLGPSSGNMRTLCVEVAPDAVGPAWAELVLETSAGTVRSQLVYGLLPNDSDGDGLADEEEAGGADRNGDGVSDELQDHVATARGVDGWSHVTLVCPPGAGLRDVATVPNPSPTDAPEGIEFPFGFLNFRVIDLVPGSAVDVDVHLPEGWALDAYWKYGPTPADPAPHWYEFAYDGLTGAELVGDLITLHFVDGLRGDHDLAANGEIVDPGAPARSLLPGGHFSLTDPRRLPDGRFECRFVGPEGSTYRVEWSPSLIPGSWTELTTFIHDSPTREITDPEAGSAPRRFYRAIRR